MSSVILLMESSPAWKHLSNCTFQPNRYPWSILHLAYKGRSQVEGWRCCLVVRKGDWRWQGNWVMTETQCLERKGEQMQLPRKCLSVII